MHCHLCDCNVGGPSIVLQVSFQTLSVRLSYNDIRLFMAIVNSMPKQLLSAYPAPQPKNASSIGLYCECSP